MEIKYPNVKVTLVGEDSNTFFIMDKVSKALKRAGIPREEVEAFQQEARSGDYDHLLQTCMKWVDTFGEDDDRTANEKSWDAAMPSEDDEEDDQQEEEEDE